MSSQFVVMKHQANRAGPHCDLRFKIPDSKMWASFACRKEIPISPGVKILAIRTNDHTEKEALLTGKIEAGYGAGILNKWDSGKCEIEKYSESHIVINFNGSKVKGIYHLVNTIVMKNKKNSDSKSYLLFKGKLS